MSRRTKSLDEPPSCKPALIPPTEYIAGADHLPSKVWPVRQSKGPRPPLPPMPMPNFFTLGRISTQEACDSTVGEMSLLLIISWSTRLALRMVSSSFCLSAANTGRISIITEVKQQSKAFLVIRALVLPKLVGSIKPFLLLFLRCCLPAPLDRILTHCGHPLTIRQVPASWELSNHTVPDDNLLQVFFILNCD